MAKTRPTLKQWLALIGLSLLSFTAYLDFTIVNTALPFIQKDLHASILELQWIVNVFSMVLCTCMIIIGKLGDMYGRKKVYLFGFSIFLISTFGAGFSNDITSLIIFRGIQGFACATIYTLGAALTPSVFPSERQTQAVGIFSALNGVGLASGPFLGGLVMQFMSWRGVFFINIPIIIIGFSLCFRHLKETPAVANVRINWFSALLLAAGLALMISAIISGSNHNWQGYYAVSMIVIGIGLLLGLVASSLTSNNPLLDLTLFQHSDTAMTILTCILASMITFVLFFFDPIFLAVIKRHAPLTIGLLILAVPLVQVVVSLLLTRLVNRFNIIHLMLAGMATGLFACLMHTQFNTNTSIIYLIITFIFMGYTWGIANTGSITVISKSVASDKIGAALGTVFTLWNLFGTIFLAISSALFHQQANSRVITLLKQQHISFDSARHSMKQFISQPELRYSDLKETTPARSHQLLEIFHHGFLYGLHHVAWFSVAIVLPGFALALYIRQQSIKRLHL